MRQLGSRRWRQAGEGALVVALAIVALWYGNFAADHAANPPDYHYLSPAIAVAAGKGFHGAVPVAGSPLDDFLSRRSMTLDWDAARSMTVGPPDRFHETTRYLINTVGYWWRIVGISWASIGDVGAVFHAVTALGTYALVRLFLPWPFALAGALWMCTSTMQLVLVPHVRDYSKGAFIIAVLPLVAVLSLWQLSRRRLLAVAVAAGALVGFGLGFKMDVAIMAPLAIGCIVLLRGRRPWTELGEKSLVVGAFVLGWALGAGPLLYRLSEGGSNSFHVVLLGFTDGFDATLGIDRSVYAFLPFYSDAYVASVIQGHSGAGQWLGFPSPEYDAAGRALFMDLVRTFPADMFARGLGAANAVMNLCFLSRDPSFLTEPLPARDFFIALYAALNRFNGWGLPLALAFVIVAAWGNLRRGMFAAVVLLVLAGYPALQFESRHYFHAQIVPVVAILVVLWAVVRPLLDLARKGAGEALRPLTLHRSPAIGIAVPIAVVLLLTAAPLSALRAYQSSRVRAVLGSYLDTRVPLQFESAAGPDGSWLVRWPQPAPPGVAGGLHAAHYVVEFQDDGSAAPLHVGIRYDAASAATDYSRVLSLQPVRGANQFGFSVFTIAGQSGFAGIEIGGVAKARLSAVYRVDSGGPAGLPLDVRLPSDWRERPLFQRLRLEPADDRALPGQPVTCSSGPGCKGLIGYLDRATAGLTPSGGAVGMIHAPIVHAAADRVEVDGRVENESSYLFQLKEFIAAGRGAFIAEGHLAEGGVSIGLLKNRAWYGQATVKSPGPFVVIVPVNDPGEYMPIVTNAMPAGQRVNRLSVTRAGFLPAAP